MASKPVICIWLSKAVLGCQEGPDFRIWQHYGFSRDDVLLWFRYIALIGINFDVGTA